jgi:hypothetical protein
MKCKGRLVTALVVGLSAGWIAPANATVINYVLSPDVSGTLAGGVTYEVSATFSWNSSTSVESNVSIVLTGAGSYAGTYTSTPAMITAVQSQVGDNQDICGQDGADAICLRFNDPLGTVPDTLEGVFAGDQAPNLDAPSTGAFLPDNGASAVLATTATVPEPSSIGLLAVGLLGCAFVLARWQRLPSA